MMTDYFHYCNAATNSKDDDDDWSTQAMQGSDYEENLKTVIVWRFG
jgi:hypothetical protein